MENIDLSKISTDELKELLQKKQKEEKKKRLLAKQEYEAKRDLLVRSLVDRSNVLHNQMRDFKQYCIDTLENFRIEALAYGDIKKTSKGGFSLRHSETQELVSLDRNTIAEYDERASIAESLIKEFLEDQVKKRDQKTYRMVAALLERNKQGDFTPGRVASLLKVKDNYDDPRWVKAMQLFEESYRVRDISYSVSFFKKNRLDKDEAISLTLASIPVNQHEQTSTDKQAIENANKPKPQ